MKRTNEFDPFDSSLITHKLGKKYKLKLRQINPKYVHLYPFTPTRWYWVSRSHEFNKWNKLFKDTRFEELIDLILESEFSGQFLRSTKNISLRKNLKDILKSFKKYLRLFYAYQFEGKLPQQIKYVLTPEIGEFPHTKHRPDFRIIEYKGKKFYEQHYFFSVHEKGLFFISRELFFRPKEYLRQREKIVAALKIIRRCSEYSWKNFSHFTYGLFAINSPGIVSYSSQNIPGFSNINMYERDFVDLIDDLIHENGHHYLNAYLNCYNLIKDNKEPIYYSPWRMALRPLRGIYHGYYTFFMGLKLFHDILLASEEGRSTGLNKRQIIKINFRFLEESCMLYYALPALKQAEQKGEITPYGMFILRPLFREEKRLRKFYSSRLKVIKKLAPTQAKKILKLKLKLEKIVSHYSRQ